MKVLDVERQLIAIASEAKFDPEAASDRERRLYRDVLMAIAGGSAVSSELARATLRSFELQFRRW